jgi:hypothetical protein
MFTMPKLLKHLFIGTLQSLITQSERHIQNEAKKKRKKEADE